VFWGAGGKISNEVKLAFEPNLAASLQIKLWQEEGNGEAEEAAREYISEVFRISDLQALGDGS